MASINAATAGEAFPLPESTRAKEKGRPQRAALKPSGC
ncbi:hypothetical protein METH_20420 [Leisingera methylohalidivorans DSM 14336]|uniref:Uncharacterized protein n=1 Tax=Leisingera methylohalidivorans DSM 14336 TaxID=999552 RepID=V9VZV9_9RHOB|nr:hypothetical protein METH_20420 [Leisingera methylohalidivorans DSM 14336]